MTARRFLDAVGTGLLVVALWSVVGIVVALTQGNVDAAWKFVAALTGSGLTMIAISVVIGFCDG